MCVCVCVCVCVCMCVCETGPDKIGLIYIKYICSYYGANLVLVLIVEGYFSFFGPLIISLSLGYLKAVSTSCWQTVSISEVITVHMSSVHNYSVVLKFKENFETYLKLHCYAVIIKCDWICENRPYWHNN